MVALGCKKCASDAGPPSPEKPGDACTPAIVVMICALDRRAKSEKKRIKIFLMVSGLKEEIDTYDANNNCAKMLTTD